MLYVLLLEYSRLFSCLSSPCVQEPGAEAKEVAVAAVDTLLWQAFASVIVPGDIG